MAEVRIVRIEELANLMQSVGAVMATCEYSGGNDEGWVEPANVVLLDGMVIRAPDVDDVYTSSYNAETRTWSKVRTEGVTDNQFALGQISEILGEPVYAKYGSFAGEFSCSGTVMFEIENDYLEIDGSETVDQWVDVEW